MYCLIIGPNPQLQEDLGGNTKKKKKLPLLLEVIMPLTGTTNLIFAFSAVAIQSVSIEPAISNNFCITDYKL